MGLTVPLRVVSAILAAGVAAAPAHSATLFAIIGDIGDSPNAAAVANMVKSRSPDYIITVGDNCYGQIPIATQIGDKYSRFVQFRDFWPSLGNHDYHDVCGNGAKAYISYFDLLNNERYYDVRLGSVNFFAVNSNPEEPDGIGENSKQAQWIKARVKGSSAPWQIVFFHHPAFSSGEHGSTEIMRWPFENWGVDAVFNGHDHDYERILRDDNKDGKKLTYFVSGLGGQSKRPFTSKKVGGSAIRYNAAFGALFMTATDTKLTFEFRNINGTVVDTYTLTK